MQIPLQITLRHMPCSQALEARITAQIAGLDKLDARITRCGVTVCAPVRHGQQGREFEVRVELHVPGQPGIIVARGHDEDVHVALRDAVDAATRQVQAFIVKRDETKKHTRGRATA